jgi:tRNA pseudouridine(38-40) synthase
VDLLKSPTLSTPPSPYSFENLTSNLDDESSSLSSVSENLSTYPNNFSSIPNTYSNSPIYTPIYDPTTLRQGLNYYLQSHRSLLLITDITVMNPTFHARFDAIARTYCYRLYAPRTPPSTTHPHHFYHHHHNRYFQSNRIWILSKPLSLLAMQQAAHYLLGEHQFAAFQRHKSSLHSNSNSIRQIYQLIIQSSSLTASPSSYNNNNQSKSTWLDFNVSSFIC